MSQRSVTPHVDSDARSARDDPAFWSAFAALSIAVAAHGLMGIELLCTRGVLVLSPLVAVPLALMAVVIALAAIARGIRSRSRDGRWLAVAAVILATGGLVELYCLVIRVPIP
ncbi:MAG TPA: hypothetical protein PLI95_21690 [Polyangiaceae bacterium]|nr:hypothetical protein [Polyangiaceae bacterium]